MLTLLLLALPASAQWGTTAAEKAATFGALNADIIGDFDTFASERHTEPCRVTYYHPREAGGNWRRWANCRSLGDRDLIPGPGGKVRPGVACVQVNRWRGWKGKLLAVEGQGLVQVLDADAYRGDTKTIWFDLAVPGPPWLYADWIADGGRVKLARNWSGYARFFEVTPAEVLGLIRHATGEPVGKPAAPAMLQDSLSTTPPASG